MAHSYRWRNILKVLLFLVCCPILLIIIGAFVPKDAGPGKAELQVGVTASIGVLGLTWLFARWERIGLDEIGVSFTRHSLSRLAAGTLIGLLLVAAHCAIVAAFGHVHWKLNALPPVNHLVIFALAYFGLSAREELAFHGYPLRRLQDPLGALAALIFIALCFALEHIAGGCTWPQAMWGAFVGSLLFGIAALATRGLAVPIGIHAAWNYGDWLRGNRTPNGWLSPVVEPSYEETARLVGIVAYDAVMILASLAFVVWYLRNEPNKVASKCDTGDHSKTA
jgi:membrane protease YdiL (CAAX protease family)